MMDIPEWAEYIAQDADGRWFAYKYKPYKTDYFFAPGRWVGVSPEGVRWFIQEGQPNPKNWHNTLVEVNNPETNRKNTMIKDTDMLQSIVDSRKANEEPSNFQWYNTISQTWISCTNWDEPIEKWLLGCDIKKVEPEKTYMDQEGTIWVWPMPMQKAPESGTTYFIPDIETGSYQVRKWKDSGKDRLNLNNGVAHKTAEGAVHQAHALQAFSRE